MSRFCLQDLVGLPVQRPPGMLEDTASVAVAAQSSTPEELMASYQRYLVPEMVVHRCEAAEFQRLAAWLGMNPQQQPLSFFSPYYFHCLCVFSFWVLSAGLIRNFQEAC